jgi:hypothetical protein
MEMNYERSEGEETITLSRRPSLLSIVVIVMGFLLVMQVCIVLVTSHLALPLLVILGGAACSAGWLAIIALEAVLPVKLKMTKDGITVGRLLGDVTLPWTDFLAVKIVPADSTLSDGASAAGQSRFAVGLFLKSRKSPRANELDADLILFGASEDHLNTLLRLVDRVSGFKATIGAGLADPARRIRKAAPIIAPTAFRKSRPAA